MKVDRAYELQSNHIVAVNGKRVLKDKYKSNKMNKALISEIENDSTLDKCVKDLSCITYAPQLGYRSYIFKYKSHPRPTAEMQAIIRLSAIGSNTMPST